jgi:uncharacterized protein YecT (DUF1311 family)
MYDKRLTGTWRSDKRRTAADILARRDIRPGRGRRKLLSLFGKLTIRYTRSKVYTTLRGVTEPEPLRIVAKDAGGVVALSRSPLTGGDVIVHTRFEDRPTGGAPRYYWISLGRFREYFRRVAVVLAAIGTLFGTARTGAQAAPGASLPRCFDTATTQSQMNRCARDEAARADAELDSVLSALLTETVKDPRAAEKVRVAQTTWLAYRDAYVEAMYPAPDKGEYGSSYPMELGLLRAKLTMRQVEALRQMRDHYSGVDQPGAAVRPSR